MDINIANTDMMWCDICESSAHNNEMLPLLRKTFKYVANLPSYERQSLIDFLQTRMKVTHNETTNQLLGSYFQYVYVTENLPTKKQLTKYFSGIVSLGYQIRADLFGNKLKTFIRQHCTESQLIKVSKNVKELTEELSQTQRNYTVVNEKYKKVVNQYHKTKLDNDDLRNRNTELEQEKIKLEQKLSDMEYKLLLSQVGTNIDCGCGTIGDCG